MLQGRLHSCSVAATKSPAKLLQSHYVVRPPPPLPCPTPLCCQRAVHVSCSSSKLHSSSVVKVTSPGCQLPFASLMRPWPVSLPSWIRPPVSNTSSIADSCVVDGSLL